MLPAAGELEDTRSVLKISAIRLTPTGFAVSLSDKRVESIQYSDSPGVKPYASGGSYQIDFFPTRTFRVQRGFLLDFHGKNSGTPGMTTLVEALNFLIVSAHQGEPADCTAMLDDQTELDAFAQLTGTWRALDEKPPLTDEVMKQRALAEDALEHQDTSGALQAYISGVAADPTWAQGWYRSALLYAEQGDYDDAAFSMKHYLILLPDAPDIIDAKAKVAMWTAKAQEAAMASEDHSAK
jgi:tetratricopeptide (TPR) repeat protein